MLIISIILEAAVAVVAIHEARQGRPPGYGLPVAYASFFACDVGWPAGDRRSRGHCCPGCSCWRPSPRWWRCGPCTGESHQRQQSALPGYMARFQSSRAVSGRRSRSLVSLACRKRCLAAGFPRRLDPGSSHRRARPGAEKPNGGRHLAFARRTRTAHLRHRARQHPASSSSRPPRCSAQRMRIAMPTRIAQQQEEA